MSIHIHLLEAEKNNGRKDGSAAIMVYHKYAFVLSTYYEILHYVGHAIPEIYG